MPITQLCSFTCNLFDVLRLGVSNHILHGLQLFCIEISTKYTMGTRFLAQYILWLADK